MRRLADLGSCSLCADRLNGCSGHAFVELEIAAADAYAADTFAIDEDGATALHGGPPVHTRGKREPDPPCTVSSGCAWAPCAEVGRLLEAAQTALVVADCTV